MKPPKIKVSKPRIIIRQYMNFKNPLGETFVGWISITVSDVVDNIKIFLGVRLILSTCPAGLTISTLREGPIKEHPTKNRLINIGRPRSDLLECLISKFKLPIAAVVFF
jgi:hypothetical protein